MHLSIYRCVCLFGFYCMSTIVGYLMPNSLSYKITAVFQTILFNISTQGNCQKHFYFKLFSLAEQFCFSNSIHYKYSFCLHAVKCQNRSISNNSI